MKIAFISLGTLGPGSLHWTGQILSRGQHLLFYVLARNKTPPVNSRYKTFLFCYVICICYIVILHLHGSKRHLPCSLLFQKNRGHNILCQDKIKHLDPPKILNQMSKMHQKASNKSVFSLNSLTHRFEISLIKCWYYKTWSISSQ